ncbi:hypothetical protein SR187_4560 [Streptococcus ruminantium]|uniref:Uncharacterized protein n=1 Tax=Streptococcus ruminantium TaxID=1917441 RepID=A0A2Z5TMD8_9STRE|nr:hypothetical protein SR187_4560 [Streptococcus ruminantium]
MYTKTDDSFLQILNGHRNVLNGKVKKNNFHKLFLNGHFKALNEKMYHSGKLNNHSGNGAKIFLNTWYTKFVKVATRQK